MKFTKSFLLAFTFLYLFSQNIKSYALSPINHTEMSKVMIIKAAPEGDRSRVIGSNAASLYQATPSSQQGQNTQHHHHLRNVILIVAAGAVLLVVLAAAAK